MQMNGTAAKVSDESEGGLPDAAETLNFCEDTLKIEVQGPTRSHFAILDIPGNFQNLTGNLTSRDLQTVTSMIKTYMGNPQSIIVYDTSSSFGKPIADDDGELCCIWTDRSGQPGRV